MKVWWEHRFWASGQPYAVYVNGRFERDFDTEAEAEAHCGWLRRRWAAEKAGLRVSWRGLSVGLGLSV